MAIDINDIKKAAARGATTPILESVLSNFGIDPKEAEAAAKEIVSGKPVEEVVPAYQMPTRTMGGVLSMPMMLGMLGIGLVAVIVMTKKGSKKKKRR